MKSVAILSLDNQDIHSDARVLRQIECLGAEYEVHVITYGKVGERLPVAAKSLRVVGSLTDYALWRRLRTVALLSLGRLLPGWAYPRWYWGRPGHRQALQALLEIRPDAIHANDWWTLPLAVEAARQTGAKVVVDFHEYALDEIADQGWWRWLYAPVVRYFLERTVPAVSASVTVNQMIAERYQQIFGIQPVVVMNAPRLAQDVAYRACAPDEIHLIHHGVALRIRQPERMMEALALMEQRFKLHFMFLDDDRYIQELQHSAERIAPGRIFFHPAVAPGKIVQELKKYDVGFFLMPAPTFQAQAALPNKFFDFVMAGLAVCVSDQPEMAQLVQQHGFGVAVPADKPLEAAQILNALSSEQISALKYKSWLARQELNAEKETAKYLSLYRDLFK